MWFISIRVSVDGPNIEEDAMGEECSSWYFGNSHKYVIVRIVCDNVMQGRYVSNPFNE